MCDVYVDWKIMQSLGSTNFSKINDWKLNFASKQAFYSR